MGREVIWFSCDDGNKSPEVNQKLEYFSVAQDLKLEQKPIKQRYRTLIQDYMRYVQSRKASLSSEEVNLLDQMLILRFNNLINQVEPGVKDGQYLSNLLGIVESNIRKVADRFSREYRKLLKARNTLGYISKVNQEKVDDEYKAMIAELRKKVFAPVLNLFSWDPSDLPEIQGLSEEDKKVLQSSTAGLSLSQLYDLIVGYMRTQNINAKVEIGDDSLSIKLDEVV